jgi:hypothetical protein
MPFQMQEMVVAHYDFVPQEANELELHRGDIVTVIDKGNTQWWKGELRGRQGLFPATYVCPYLGNE